MAASQIVVPSLGQWVTDPLHQLNIMFASTLVSDYSQSTIYYGQVTSLAYLVAMYQGNQAEMATALENALQQMFIRVFPIIDVSVTYSDPVNGTYILYISITATVDGTPYTLSASVNVDNGVLLLVAKELNA